jgi:hypothetical protein
MRAVGRITRCMGRASFSGRMGRVTKGIIIWTRKKAKGLSLGKMRNDGRPTGQKYVGGWVNGKQEGEGVFYDENNVSKRGVWENGENVKWLD